MSFTLPELLNPSPQPEDTGLQGGRKSPSPPAQTPLQRPQLPPVDSIRLENAQRVNHRPGDNNNFIASAHDAADALAYLANSAGPPLPRVGSPGRLGPNSVLENPKHYVSQDCQEKLPGDSFRPIAAPVEPSPPHEPRRASTLSTLDQYHHRNHSSAEQLEQRRHAIELSSELPPPRLPPIRPTFFSTLDARMPEQPSERTASPRNEDNPPQTSAFADATMSDATPKRETPGSDAIDNENKNEASREAAKEAKAEVGAPTPGQLAPDAREPTYTHTEPVTAQIRQPSPGPLPTLQEPSITSPPSVQVKAEPSATPREPSPSSPLPPAVKESKPSGQDLGMEQLSVPGEAGEVKDEGSIKASSTRGSTPAQSAIGTTGSTKQGESKKRAAPKSTSKKGTASTIKKPAAKKRRLSTESVEGGRSSKRSATPASSRASKGPANRKYSATPLASSPGPDEEDVEDDGQIFCICRKPDNHTWMIACDGGCDDWFHGKCVKINEEDGDLIDRYVCPNCSEAGYGHTSWKPMCRLNGCRQPARLSKNNLSKYCSDEHGQEFMRQSMLRIKPDLSSTTSSKGKRSRAGAAGAATATAAASSHNAAHHETIEAETKGGVLKPSEISTLVKSATSIDTFRRLGESILPLSPPATNTSPHSSPPPRSSASAAAAAAAATVAAVAPPTLATPSLELTPPEALQLSHISAQKASLKDRRLALQDRERFTHLIKDAARRHLETTHGGQKAAKDLCGYDPRLAWSDDEFDEWRLSEAGRRAFSTDIIDEEPRANEAEPGAGTGPDADGPVMDGIETNAVSSNPESAPAAPAASNTTTTNPYDRICTRKRCERHKQWLKVAMQDLRFEEANLADDMRRLEREEGGIRERAALRALGAGAGANPKEGNVEVVG
ncbi:hypothetical protein L228DRAFT_261391 [Xylona heveae TC161]|uniref:PHD-type domain-containing protein n=1 Tax=Xylona heveae (strain CBS 132557 / TC161) TaxID=1328760 RepID=A0A165GHF2_XYLHT|nr:hypothetical protein L228DRAFT_261391 [Xylona heveae TC161]KZF22187.1 hypothetical protein L228DRAFT_261391 [Xylona heveae TC161]